MRLGALALALLVSLVPATFVSTAVEAQTPKNDPFTDMARQRFQEGVKLYDQAKYEEARAAFLQAWALKKHPAVLLNLAQSELRSNHPVEAARHFSEYLREYPETDAGEKKAAQKGLEAARAKTGQLDIKVDKEGAEIFIDDDFVGKAPLPEAVYVAPGSRKVEVRLAGFTSRTVQADALLGDVKSVTVNLADTAGAGAIPGASSTGSQQPSSDEGVTFDTGGGRKPFVTWALEDPVAWVGAGVTVVGLGLGIGFTVAASSAQNNADYIAGQIGVVAERDADLKNYGGFDRTKNPCASPVPITASTNYQPACGQLQDNMDARDDDRIISYVGWGLAGAGVGVIVAGYFLRGDDDTADQAATPRPSTAVAPVIAPDFQGLSVGGTF